MDVLSNLQFAQKSSSTAWTTEKALSSGCPAFWQRSVLYPNYPQKRTKGPFTSCQTKTFTVLRKQGTKPETAHLRRIINEQIGLHEDVMVIVWMSVYL